MWRFFKPILSRIKRDLLWLCAQFIRILHIQFVFPRNPKILEITDGCVMDPLSASLCIFASFSRTGEIADYIFFHLESLKEQNFDIIFVTTAKVISAQSMRRLKSTCIKIIHRKNIGLDFGSWKAGLFYSGVELRAYERLLLANDSCYGPLFPLDAVLQSNEADVYGLTDSFEISYHIMSYFVIYHKKIFQSAAFINLWKNVRMLPASLKDLIVLRYEVGMSKFYLQNGYLLKAYCSTKKILEETHIPFEKLTDVNITRSHWRYLIENKHLPMIKRDIFQVLFKKDNDWTWRDVIAQTGYDIKLITTNEPFFQQKTDAAN